jgi:hypothetical protein
MKIAIIEWYPRLCGAVSWSVHLSAARHHQVDLVTFSKSGRGLKPWETVSGKWKVFKIADAVNILNSYDLVILGDIVCRSPEVRKGDSDPYYLSVMERVTTPWTAMIHDGSYAGKESPQMARMLKMPSFSNVLLTTRYPEASARIAALSRDHFLGRTPPEIKWAVNPYLPYDFSTFTKVDIDTKPDRADGVMFLGRLSTNKGQDAMLDLARDFSGDVELYGFNSYGRPSYGWLLWELARSSLMAESFTEESFPVKSRPLSHLLAHKFYTGPFSLHNKYGRIFAYRGVYGPNFEGIDWSPRISVNLTNSGWKGSLEYATLDAMANGLIGVVPKQQIEYADYKHMVTVPYVRRSFKPDKNTVGNWLNGKEEWDRAAILDTLESLRSLSTEEAKSLAVNQLTEIRARHDVDFVMSTYLNGVMGNV